jgi:CheY-like chemotaxis protein
MPMARQLRVNPTLAATRILAITGSRNPADRQRARAAGCETVLAKPVDPEVFETLIAGN